MIILTMFFEILRIIVLAIVFVPLALIANINGHMNRTCPPLQDERKATWTDNFHGLPQMECGDIDGKCWVFSTTTWDGDGKVLYQTGYEPDVAAIEHNKRVRECQTINGEF